MSSAIFPVNIISPTLAMKPHHQQFIISLLTNSYLTAVVLDLSGRMLVLLT